MKDKDLNYRLKQEIYKILPKRIRVFRNVISVYSYSNKELTRIRDILKEKYSSQEPKEKIISKEEQSLFKIF